jgi:hypothetical protein
MNRNNEVIASFCCQSPFDRIQIPPLQGLHPKLLEEGWLGATNNHLVTVADNKILQFSGEGGNSAEIWGPLYTYSFKETAKPNIIHPEPLVNIHTFYMYRLTLNSRDLFCC